MKAADGSLLLARTMDWEFASPHPIALPAGYRWDSAYNGRALQNANAILAVGHCEVGLSGHADVSDGVNSYGLSVQKLTFSNASQYVQKAHTGKIQLVPFEVPLWLLGNCVSVADVRLKIAELEVMTDEFSEVKYGRNDLHFVAADVTGAMVNIEPRDGKLVILDNPIGVVTNAPNFAREIDKLNQYLDLSAQPGRLNEISTANFHGKSVMPGGFTPTARFVRATLLKEYAVTPCDELGNVIETFHILNNVTVPKSQQRSTTYTIYRSAVDLRSRTLYYQAYADLSLQRFSWPEFSGEKPLSLN